MPSIGSNLKVLKSLKGVTPSQQQLQVISRQVLLPCAEVKMWLDHLSAVQLNHKRGAAKAAETQNRKAQQTEFLRLGRSDKCGICGEEYEDETLDEVFIFHHCPSFCVAVFCGQVSVIKKHFTPGGEGSVRI